MDGGEGYRRDIAQSREGRQSIEDQGGIGDEQSEGGGKGTAEQHSRDSQQSIADQRAQKTSRE